MKKWYQKNEFFLPFSPSFTPPIYIQTFIKFQVQQIKWDTIFNTFVRLRLINNIFKFLLLYLNYDECLQQKKLPIWLLIIKT